jgi:hypothetical protein
MVRVDSRLEIARQSVDPDVALFFLRAMTADAVLRQKGFKRFRAADGTGEAEAEDCVEDETRT